MKFKKFGLFVILSLTVIFIASGVIISARIKTQVKELFKLNKGLQQEGYYMADFEFKMMGFAYQLDKGQYFEALNSLSEYHSKLTKREGLLKIPDFKNNQEEIDFFLNLQNPRTGAFIDESAPFCVYYAITQNVFSHLEALADSTTTSLNLKYPLKFLDEINTPDKITAFLNDVSYVGWIASKFPQTSFVFAREIFDCVTPGNILERNNFYSFSPEWKHTMLDWMYNFQDSTTGLWGPKNRKTSKLLMYDLNNTASILKVFRDKGGNDLFSDFPLRYADKIFLSSLDDLSEPYPDDEESLDEIHEWNLKTVKGINMLLRYLWRDASVQNKMALEDIIENFIKLSFDKYYVESEGAFSYYPNAGHASADGFSNTIYEDIGAFSYEKQKKIFGVTVDSVKNLGIISGKDLKPFLKKISESDLKINSVRFYKTRPDITNLTGNVWAVYYPDNSGVLDVTELVPGLIAWADSTKLAIGNWTSVAETKQYLKKLNINKPVILPENTIENALSQNDELYCIGFNILQLPKFSVKFEGRSK